MRIFQALLAVVWVVVFYVTVVVTQRHGLAASMDVFSADFDAMDWHAQFDIDLLANFLLVAVWAAWRERFSPRGIIAGICCLFGGSVVSFAYIFVLSFFAGGEMKKLVLGRHYA